MSGPGCTARLVAVGSVRSCAVTTTTVALGCAWPDPPDVLLVEADPAGGTLAATLGLAGQPGLVSLATAARRDTHPGLVAEHTQLLPCGVRVVVAPPSGEQARAALRMLGDPLALLSAAARVVLVDCGRLDADSPTDGLFAGADVSLLVVRPQLPDLHALAVWLEGHRDRAGRLAVVLCGPGPYGAGEVTDALGIEVLGGLPWDPPSVATLGQPPDRRARNSALRRAAVALATEVAGRLPGPAEPPAAAVDETSAVVPDPAVSFAHGATDGDVGPALRAGTTRGPDGREPAEQPGADPAAHAARADALVGQARRDR